MKKIIGPLFAVVVVYFSTVFVLWLLGKIGPITAVVEGVIEKGGGNIWFAAGGVLAAFVIISSIGLFALYMMLKLVIEKAAPLVHDKIRESITNSIDVFFRHF